MLLIIIYFLLFFYLIYLLFILLFIIVSANCLLAYVSPESAPIKRIVQVAKDEGRAVDATYGRRTRAVLIMDSGHVILSAVQPETVAGRLDKEDTNDTIVEEKND